MTQEWQPIETAPKDGTDIIVYCPPTEPIIEFFEGEGPELIEDEKPETISVARWDFIDSQYIVFGAYWPGEISEPTHWMPLPQPPKVTK